MTHEERLALAQEMNRKLAAIKQAGQIATRDLIREDSLSPDEITGLVDLYPVWAAGMSYAADDLIAYGGTLYQVIQAHTSQADWTPDAVPALFVSKTPAGVIPDWVQPTGAHDAYNIGDKVLFEGLVYESLINANTWSPTAYPAGWQIIS
ncbi:MAG: hypothetical protein EWM48_02110 [Sphaerochaeta sp.]|nr:MAG: hypothetical protein EWM48_02110 [Sphaerochaeta sp.]